MWHSRYVNSYQASHSEIWPKLPPQPVPCSHLPHPLSCQARRPPSLWREWAPYFLETRPAGLAVATSHRCGSRRGESRAGSGVGLQAKPSETWNHQASILEGRSKFDLRYEIKESGWAGRWESPSSSLPSNFLRSHLSLRSPTGWTRSVNKLLGGVYTQFKATALEVTNRSFKN